MRPLPSSTRAPEWGEHEGIIDLDPGPPSESVESKISFCRSIEEVDLLFDDESAYRLVSVDSTVVSGVGDRFFPDEEQDAFGPSRVLPRLYLKIKDDVSSIKKELLGLTSIHRGGIPPLSLALKTDLRVKKLPWIRSTLAVRKKASGVWKSRLCLRGDTVTLQVENFTSSPHDSSCFIEDDHFRLSYIEYADFHVRCIDGVFADLST